MARQATEDTARDTQASGKACGSREGARGGRSRRPRELQREPLRDSLQRVAKAAEGLSSSCNDCLAQLKHVETLYGEKVVELQLHKERLDFAARHRDFVSKFEDRVFRRVVNSAAYGRALQAGAGPLQNKEDALNLLHTLASAEEDPDDEDCAAVLTEGNLLMRKAWEQAVLEKGLYLEEYQALRVFKDCTNRAFHQPLEAADALRQLTTSLPMPDDYKAAKAPLIKLLGILAKPTAGAR
ncbi:hypothetical protein HYH03_008785 [Edaphochlamys debaryana]|uniref:Uncharacterized protein n=1 Tax=Edaphochlamys debaryana TaxID=47281 RepID=A0A835XZH7_9CHLO|nr:hypothetical protein HYH03_008785 [Edaphochlamys debaryana]|eukprot:KAG2492870.1 hypothetical protein HYH03_008785 [Edaphochlamys debaryana]